jgi:transposase
LLIRQRTMLVNALRSHFAEFGIVVAKGIENVAKLAAMIEDKAEDRLPAAAVSGLSIIIQQLKALKMGNDKLEKEIRRWHQKNPESRRLATIPGIGPITASAMSATIADPQQFKSGRHLAAWLGIVPRQNSSGGKERLGKLSKQGDRYLRQLLVVGATSVLGVVHRKQTANNAWGLALLERKPPRLVTVALANKMARIAWAIMVRRETFKVRAA